MYDRAPRNIGQLAGATPLHVGPGTYDVSKSKKEEIVGYAPFLSLAPRDDIFVSVGVHESPGPGQYDLSIHAGNIKGGSTVANRETRFKNKYSDVPGPGTYSVPSTTATESRYKFSESKIPKQLGQKVKIVRKNNAPSIQDPKQAFGFEETQAGELIAQKAPDRDGSLGPAYYAPKTSGKSVYKGIHFAKYSAKRTDFSGNSSNPGPGDYDTTEAVKIDVQHYNIKNESKIELLIPRYPEAHILNVEKESLPGPGKYEQKRLFDDVSKKPSEILGIEYERPPFGVQTRRFEANKSTIPGPGAYNEPITALSSLNKIHGLKNTPFQTSASRFEHMKIRSAPGPGEYRIPGFAEQNLRKSIIEAQRKPAFGHSAARKFNLTKKDEFSSPGPAQYQIKEKTFKPRHDYYTSNFASTTKRDQEVEETPGPTAYNVPSAYENLVKAKREGPRTKNAQRRHESFNTAAKRDLKLNNEEDVPGPGAYDVGSLKNKAQHFAKLNEKRWKDSKDNLPGPADYELSPLFQDTVLRGTFNATLHNPFQLKDKQAKLAIIDKVTDMLQVS